VRGDVERWELDDGKVEKIHPSIFIHSFVENIHLSIKKGSYQRRLFVGLALVGKDIVSRFIIEYLY
jgi:hypothetical protein